MSWFSSLSSAIGGSSILGSVVMGAAVVGGAYLTTSANKSAAKKVAAAQIDAANRVAAAATTANQRSQAVLDQSQGGLAALNEQAASNPAQLTPYQQQRVDEMREGQANFIAATGLKGAGRAATDAVRAREDSTVNQFISQNDQSKRSAASQLAGIAAGTTQNMNQTDLSAANVGGLYATGGAATTGQAQIANADATGSALGAIGALINQDLKRESRRTSTNSTTNSGTP